MGTLLSGRYGAPPEARSGELTLQSCAQRLNLKPSDFVSQGEPAFFKEAFGTRGRYLLFKLEAGETAGSPIWKPGYYLLPLDAIDVLAAFEKKNRHPGSSRLRKLPVELESEKEAPPEVVERARRWADDCQPLFFACSCDRLGLRLDAPRGLRRAWKARLRCPKKCQPALTTTL